MRISHTPGSPSIGNPHMVFFLTAFMRTILGSLFQGPIKLRTTKFYVSCVLRQALQYILPSPRLSLMAADMFATWFWGRGLGGLQAHHKTAVYSEPCQKVCAITLRSCADKRPAPAMAHGGIKPDHAGIMTGVYSAYVHSCIQ